MRLRFLRPGPSDRRINQERNHTMPTLYGTTPEFGIKNSESGILVESMNFDGSMEKYEQKDHMGKVIGVYIIDEKLSFSMSGALPLGGDYTLTMGSTLLLNNTIPPIWNNTPKATTVFIETVKRSMTNTGPVKLDVSGTVYAFGSASSEE